MISSTIFLTVFSNSLIAFVLSFFLYYILRLHCSGGFWLMALIALIGAYVGTFLGIIYQFMSWHLPQIVIALIIPAISSALFITVYVYLNTKDHQD